MTNVNQVLSKVLKKIKPSKEEQELIDSLKEGLENLRIPGAKVFVGGSVGKGTWLKDNHDIDVFVRFNYRKYNKKNISKELENFLKKYRIKYDKLYGSRYYFRVQLKNIFKRKLPKDYVCEFVPIIEIKKPSQALNLTDISPFHTEWVNKLPKKLLDEIRLAKHFFKANRLYGAESYIRGFSGYVLEILVAQYKGFVNLLEACQKWKNKDVIDISKYYSSAEKAYENLNPSKRTSPIIVIDPVDKKRNASAALVKEKVKKLQDIAKRFLEKPSDKFFKKTKTSFDKLKGNILWIEAKVLNKKEDVAGAKLVKFIRLLKKEFKLFGVKENGWQWDKKNAQIWLILDKKKISSEFEMEGPLKDDKENVKRFCEKHENYCIKKDRYYTTKKRPHITIKQVYDNFIENTDIKQYINSIEKVDVKTEKK